MGRGLGAASDAARRAGRRTTPPLRPGPSHSRSGRAGNRGRLHRQRPRLASQPGRRSRAVQPPGGSHAQVAGQAPHQAMDRTNAPVGTRAGRGAAADMPPAAGPETRRRHRNGPGLLDPRHGVGGLPDGPAAIPARPVGTGRADRGHMGSCAHRRGSPPVGRSGRTDAGIGQGNHRRRDSRTARRPGPDGPPGVHNRPGRPPCPNRPGRRATR